MHAAKFYVAGIMAVVAYVRSAWGLDLGIDDATATGIVGAVTAALVYFTPNKA